MFCLAGIGGSCPHPMEAFLAAFRWSSSSAHGNTKPRLASATASHLCGEAQKEAFRASVSWRTKSNCTYILSVENNVCFISQNDVTLFEGCPCSRLLASSNSLNSRLLASLIPRLLACLLPSLLVCLLASLLAYLLACLLIIYRSSIRVYLIDATHTSSSRVGAQ